MKLFEILPTVIILFISITAFASGFYQSNINTHIKGLNDQISQLDETRTSIESNYNLLRQQYEDNNIIQGYYYKDAFATSDQYSILKGQLNQTERNAYLAKIVDDFQAVIAFQEAFIIVKMYRHFEVDQNITPYVFASKKSDGYNYNITIGMWNSYKSSTGDNFTIRRTIVNMYEKYLWPCATDCLAYLAKTSGIRNPVTSDNVTYTIYTTTGNDKLAYILLAPVRDITTKLNKLENEISNLQTKGKLITQGVSIVAISTILAGIMVNRINDKHSKETFNEIKKSLNIIDYLPKTNKDLISIPVLVIAALLSIFGILYPLIG